MAKRYGPKTIGSVASQRVFFDANVLVYLFWPTGLQHWELQYAKLFSRLLKQSNQFITDITVISEVINSMLRVEHKKSSPNSPFKPYRDSKVGRAALADIHTIVKGDILPNFELAAPSLGKADIEGLLYENELDFSDKIIEKLCIDQGLILLTNDKDFRKSNVDIISANPALSNKAK